RGGSRRGRRRVLGGEGRLRVLQALLRIVIVRIDPQGLLIIRDPFLVVLQIGYVGVTPLCVNVGIGFDLQALVVIGDGLVVFLLAAKHEPTSFIGLRIVGIFLQDRCKIRSRFVPVPQSNLGEPAQSYRQRIVGFQLGRLT